MVALRLAFEAQAVHKKLGSSQALAGLSLKLDAGVMHGIIGPEGAGKTTLLRTFLGLLKPDAGEIIYRSHDSSVAFGRIRNDIAYMPQQQSLYGDLSIGEHLDFFCALYQIPKPSYAQKRKELLHITRLSDFVDRPAGKLSGGMYKKLGLMCALLRSPQAVFLDEPTNGVDPISRREFWELLYQLLAQKILIVIATSYMDEAERCSQVHLMEAGRCLAEGDPQQILAHEGVDNFDAFFIKRSPAVLG